MAQADQQQGKLIILSGPSGSGKTTIVRHLLEHHPELTFSVSATTRNKRKGEIAGKDYYFLSEAAFREKIKQKAFLEYEEVYDSIFYGTLKAELERIWAKGHHVIFDVDVKGGTNIKKAYPNRGLALFVRAPDLQTLRKRLMDRLTETPEVVEQRLARVEEELQYEKYYDATIVNDDLHTALREADKRVSSFIREGQQVK